MDERIPTWICIFVIGVTFCLEVLLASIMSHQREEQYQYHLQDYKWHIINWNMHSIPWYSDGFPKISNEFMLKDKIRIIIKLSHFAKWFANHWIKWSYARQNENVIQFMVELLIYWKIRDIKRHRRVPAQYTTSSSPSSLVKEFPLLHHVENCVCSFLCSYGYSGLYLFLSFNF